MHRPFLSPIKSPTWFWQAKKSDGMHCKGMCQEHFTVSASGPCHVIPRSVRTRRQQSKASETGWMSSCFVKASSQRISAKWVGAPLWHGLDIRMTASSLVRFLKVDVKICQGYFRFCPIGRLSWKRLQLHVAQITIVFSEHFLEEILWWETFNCGALHEKWKETEIYWFIFLSGWGGYRKYGLAGLTWVQTVTANISWDEMTVLPFDKSPVGQADAVLPQDIGHGQRDAHVSGDVTKPLVEHLKLLSNQKKKK